MTIQKSSNLNSRKGFTQNKLMIERWEQTLNTLKTEVSPHTYNTWFKPLQCKTFDQNKFFVEVPNSYYKEKIQKEYSNILLNHLRQATMNQDVQLSFILSEETLTVEKPFQPTVEIKDIVTGKQIGRAHV